MANAKIMWTQKVAGRDEGHVETVELDTPFMRGCLKNKRFKVIEYVKPKPSESGPAKPKPGPKPKSKPEDDVVEVQV